MDVNHAVSALENYDAVVDWQQKLSNVKSEELFYSISSAIVSFYGRLAKEGALKSTGPSKAKKIAKWLNEQLDDLWEIVLSALNSYPMVASSVALKLILTKGKYAQSDIHPMVTELLNRATTNVLEELKSSFVEYDDLRYLYLVVVPSISAEKLPALVNIMCDFQNDVKHDTDLMRIYATKSVLPFDERKAALKYRNAHQAAWLHVLQNAQLSSDEIKQILTVMHVRIIPNFSKPQLLMDFIVDAYDHGGAVSLLALNAVFVLIQYHQLDYPQFFLKLYDLLEDGSLLVSTHRARFFRLLDLFLTSTHLPAMIPASIIKRLARLCLFAPPGAIVAILPFIYNQMKRHQTCMVMIHRPDVDESNDPFDNYEKDPLLTKALDSSLWELQSLTTHYHPNVAAIAKIFSQPFKKPQYQLDHFLSHSYETLYSTEAKRKRDREPALEFEQYNILDDMDTWSL